MHIHILGICGTFMGGVAMLARQLGHKVTKQRCQCLPANEYHVRGARHRDH